jgi:HlyD family secretion protein
MLAWGGAPMVSARKGWRMRHGSAGAAAALVVVLLLVGGCDRGADERFAAETVRTAEVVERVSAPGAVQAAGQAELKAPAAARVERLVVKDGDEVGSGELVAELSSEQIDDQVRQAQAAVDAASSLGGVAPSLPTGAALSAFQQVQSQVTATSAAVIAALRAALPLVPRAQRARLQQRIDRAQVRVAELQRQADQAASQAAAAADAQAAAMQQSIQAATAAQRSQAELALELARDQQERLTLRSPLDGTVQLGRSGGASTTLPQIEGLPEGASEALQGLGGSGGQAAATGPPLRVGSEVAAGQTVATVFDVSDLLVAAEVDETDIALVKPGQRARVELDAFPQATFAAKVRRVAVAPTSGQSAAGGVTYQVDLVLGEAESGTGSAGGTEPVPRVGMTATAAIEVRRTTDELSVPGSALVGRAGGQAVFVVENGKVRLRPVQVAADGEDRVAVASGLRPGERVVSRGAERLRDGQDWPP